jgi:hypothetical protein
MEYRACDRGHDGHIEGRRARSVKPMGHETHLPAAAGSECCGTAAERQYLLPGCSARSPFVRLYRFGARSAFEAERRRQLGRHGLLIDRISAKRILHGALCSGLVERPLNEPFQHGYRAVCSGASRRLPTRVTEIRNRCCSTSVLCGKVFQSPGLRIANDLEAGSDGDL